MALSPLKLSQWRHQPLSPSYQYCAAPTTYPAVQLQVLGNANTCEPTPPILYNCKYLESWKPTYAEEMQILGKTCILLQIAYIGSSKYLETHQQYLIISAPTLLWHLPVLVSMEIKGKLIWIIRQPSVTSLPANSNDAVPLQVQLWGRGQIPAEMSQQYPSAQSPRFPTFMPPLLLGINNGQQSAEI